MAHALLEDGTWVDEIPDGNGHSIDAVRYAVMDYVLRGWRRGFFDMKKDGAENLLGVEGDTPSGLSVARALAAVVPRLAFRHGNGARLGGDGGEMARWRAIAGLE